MCTCVRMLVISKMLAANSWNNFAFKTIGETQKGFRHNLSKHHRQHAFMVVAWIAFFSPIFSSCFSLLSRRLCIWFGIQVSHFTPILGHGQKLTLLLPEEIVHERAQYSFRVSKIRWENAKTSFEQCIRPFIMLWIDWNLTTALISFIGTSNFTLSNQVLQRNHPYSQQQA